MVSCGKEGLGSAHASVSGGLASCAPLESLPAELHTGHLEIDAEHARLMACMASLHRICVDSVNMKDCRGCAQKLRSTCEKNLISHLGDLFAFILDHFQTEEKIMRDSMLIMLDRDLCEAHMEDHAAISGKVQEIVAHLDPMNHVECIRELNRLLSRWVVNHVEMHDLMLARWSDASNGKLPGMKAAG